MCFYRGLQSVSSGSCFQGSSAANLFHMSWSTDKWTGEHGRRSDNTTFRWEAEPRHRRASPAREAVITHDSPSSVCRWNEKPRR